MKTYLATSNYGNEIRLTLSDAESCSPPGESAENGIITVLKKPYVRNQIKNLNPNNLRKELEGFGAWDDEQLNDHPYNLIRWLWISAGTILDLQHENEE